MAKRFTKFYFKEFRPITKLEHDDLKQAKQNYNIFTFVGTLTFGYMSFRYRRMKVSMLEPHEAAKNVSAFLPQHLLNDAMAGFMGFTFGNVMACDYIYKRRIYVVERLHYEKQNNFNRYAFKVPEDRLPDEYPFAAYITLTDKDIIEDRQRAPSDDSQQDKKVQAKL